MEAYDEIRVRWILRMCQVVNVNPVMGFDEHQENVTLGIVLSEEDVNGNTIVVYF